MRPYKENNDTMPNIIENAMLFSDESNCHYDSDKTSATN